MTNHAYGDLEERSALLRLLSLSELLRLYWQAQQSIRMALKNSVNNIASKIRTVLHTVFQLIK